MALDDAKRQRVLALAGAAAPSGRRPACPWLLALLAAARVAPAAAGKYWVHDYQKSSRMVMHKCKTEFECPAFQRPVQRDEEVYKVWTWSHCLNKGRGYLDVKFADTLATCCQSKYICMQTCGMKIQDCFDHYWQCAEYDCGKHKGQEYKSCLATAGLNDLRHVSQEPYEHFQKDGEDQCKAIEDMQNKACACVPTAEWETKLLQRFESFLRDHEPEMLNSKGMLKDKKFWKLWKGKRAQLFLSVTLKHKDKVVNVRNVPQPKRPPTEEDSRRSEM